MKTFLFLVVWTVPALSVDLNITIKNLESEKGQIICSLFNEETFLKKQIQRQTTALKKKENSCRFTGLSEGEYAVSVLQDEDKDGELDTNFLGIPSEPIAMSNNAKGSFGPPSWEDAKFNVGKKNLSITVDFDK